MVILDPRVSLCVHLPYYIGYFYEYPFCFRRRLQGLLFLVPVQPSHALRIHQVMH